MWKPDVEMLVGENVGENVGEKIQLAASVYLT
jgi:hypothetical protein